MPRVHLMTFEPTGNMSALLLVGVASAFVTVSHVKQLSVRRMAKRTLKEFIESQKVSDVSNTSPNATIRSLFASLAALLSRTRPSRRGDFTG